MKKIIVTFCIALITSLSLWGCGSNDKDKAETPIELNNGEKWTVDTAMLTHITAMETAVANFNTADGIDSLKTKLKAEIKELTSKCTMQGKAHDELHKWLLPLIKMVDTMQGVQSIESLKQHFITFHIYFE